MKEYNRLTEYRKLLKRQQIEREIFLAHGLNERDIKELFRQDYNQLYGDAKYYRMLADKPYEEYDRELFSGAESKTDLLDDIENPNLYRALKALSEQEFDILISHVLLEERLKEIAARYGIPENTIRGTYRRIQKKIKIFFEK